MATILLLEPNRKLATSYKQALEEAGHQVHWQADAQKALGVVDDHNPHLVVMEVHLPKHNSIEFLYEIRSYPDCDHIPVLLHTAVATDHPGLGHAYWEQLGIKDCLYKPQTSLKQLVERVSNLTTKPQTA